MCKFISLPKKSELLMSSPLKAPASMKNPLNKALKEKRVKHNFG